MRLIDHATYALLFERAEETLSGGIIPTIAFARYTHDHPNLRKLVGYTLGWCIDVLYHCKATVLLWGGVELQSYSKHFPLLFHHNRPT